ncbi:MAG: magnesium transporter [Deltaproteobacteria bacterium]|nr:magnesium transporter [Deltaproteobacteria bacterium]
MLTPKMQITMETTRKLLRMQAMRKVSNVIQKLHPADLAQIFPYFSEAEQRIIFNLIKDPAKGAEVLSEIEWVVGAQLLQTMDTKWAIQILQEMPSDDAAEIISNLPEELAEELLQGMKKKDLEEVEGLLSYPEETAGRIMNPVYFSLHENTTVREAIKAVQKEADTEMVLYIYVVDDRKHLVGVVSLRQLLLVASLKRLREIMSTEVFSVQTSEDQEEVARVVEKYNILAVPVVDEENKLVGVITVDDVIDILRDEATEDFLKMAGTREEEFVYVDDVLKVSRLRFPWLITNLLGGLITGYLLWLFKITLEDVLALITFIPVITAMGGNAGLQSSTIMIRGFATGRIEYARLTNILFKELRVGIIMGLICGSVVGGVATLWHGNPIIGVVVCMAMIIAMTVACTMGALVPSFFRKLHIDPAIASGPFVTTANDITGIVIYMGTATIFLKYLIN